MNIDSGVPDNIITKRIWFVRSVVPSLYLRITARKLQLLPYLDDRHEREHISSPLNAGIRVENTSVERFSLDYRRDLYERLRVYINCKLMSTLNATILYTLVKYNNYDLYTYSHCPLVFIIN